jgi:hypothetical protein
MAVLVEECYLVSCDAMHSGGAVGGGGILPTFRRNILSPSVGQKMEAVGSSETSVHL